MGPKRCIATNPCLRIAKVLSRGKAKDMNFVFSPYSFELGLSLLANGSSGSTKEELLSFLEAKSLNDVNSRNTSHFDCFTRTTTDGPNHVLPCTEEDLSFREPKSLNDVDSVNTPLLDRTDEEDLSSDEEVLSSDEEDLSSDEEDLSSVDDVDLNDFARTRPIISFVGGIWVDQHSILKPTFKAVAEQIYKGKAETVDFQNKAKEVVDKVNEWAEEATNGLIKCVLPEDSLKSMTGLVLANAIYFKAEWEKQFYQHETKDSKFFLLDGNSVEVPFMTSREDQTISTIDDFKILKLKYATDWSWEVEDEMLISMYIILPNQRDGLWNLAEKVGSDPMFLDKYFHPHAMVVSVEKFMIPKFKITCAFEASEILQEVGLNLPFSDEAEFDDMVVNRKLKVSKVRHQSHISVNEEGTEAAAATAIGCLKASDGYSPKLRDDFVADHPFMFMVRDDESGVVLFMGHVVNPLLE